MPLYRFHGLVWDRLNSFLLDTGADKTMIHPEGAGMLGFNFARDFAGIEPHRIPGVGISSGWLERVVVRFKRTDGTVDTLNGRVLVAKPSETNRRHPNLLGRDIFDNYSILYDRANNRLELRP